MTTAPARRLCPDDGACLHSCEYRLLDTVPGKSKPRKGKSKTPTRLFGLPDIPELLNERFNLVGYDALEPSIARTWWNRSKPGGYIQLPMPTPDFFLAGPRPRPLWNENTIVAWYGEWKGLET